MHSEDFAYSDVPPERAIEDLFGITESDLRDTMFDCFRSFVSAGPLHPKGSGGTLAWIHGIRALRAKLLAKGWTSDDPRNQPRVVSPDGKHAITVICGDANTGNPNQKPLTRNKRGSQTTSSVYYNAGQQDLFPVSLEELQRFTPGRNQEQTLWILLFHVDVPNRVVHYELSRPINMAENEKVDDWAPRFIMPPLKLGEPDESQGPASSPDIDIPVTPRS
ncbi:hypothetical protein [Pseudomonas tremae]|uniref:hypothetical protein n=1 Tax=Pseudomonas tremae TaxID=200454 RepID=UPI001F23324E|nr:hypothetical protein [Pseudomonas tremae]MCF5747956.1 hypothetical protein [Pseudomonas tremae]UQB37462.1 hypothetical protein I9H09_03465 [Pseudomonas tremae]